MTSNSISITTTSLRAFYELTKPRLASLVMLSTFVGFYLASKGPLQVGLMMTVMIGTSLVAAGSLALNQWMEAKWDAQMKRTENRPVPAGVVSAQSALVFGLLLSLAGIALLFFFVNFTATLFAMVTHLSYIAVYTPLKRTTSLCTIVGALPGAIPPLIGWSAVTGKPPFEAWIIFAIIFLWQMPHFLAIAWLYREDFKRAGFKMLSVEDPTGKHVARQILLYSAALLPVSLMPSVVGLTGSFYFFSALFLGVAMILFALRGLKQLNEMARLLFRTSILYLTLIFILLMADKV